ncbi:MAG TPA: PLP-dependent aminotransferase family protein, partial [Dehalococcoidia bacterium]
MVGTHTASASGTGQPWSEAEIMRLFATPARTAQGWTPGPPADKPVISLTAGVPDAPTFPAREVGEAAGIVLEREPEPALEYLLGTPQGVPELRRMVVEEIEPEPGLVLSAENVTITSGSAHAFACVCQTFLDPGDYCVIEAPTYAGAIRTAMGSGARFATVPMDEQGMRVDLLEETLARLEHEGTPAKLIYVIPIFHNPAGVTMPLERRRQLIEIASRHRVLVVEDDAYGELRYRGAPVPSLLALSGGEGVLRCGTVSKTIAPGLRVGWIKGPKPLIDGLVRMRFDNGTSPFAQRIVRAYVEQGYFRPHVALVRDVYKAKFEAMDAALGEHLGGLCSWTDPDGGFFIWVKLPSGTSQAKLAELAAPHKIIYNIGPNFMPNGGGEEYIR